MSNWGKSMNAGSLNTDPLSTGQGLQMQQTLKNTIKCSGVGVHGGQKVTLVLHPAEPDFGIVFQRTGLDGPSVTIPARWENAIETPLCTTLTDGQVKISTVEHLLSALSGMGVDNCRIEVNADELPIMDGSAAPFLFLLQCAGLKVQDTPRRALRILKEIRDLDEHRSATLSPVDEASPDAFTASFDINFNSRAIGRQEFFTRITPENYGRTLARARTFGFLEDVEKLRQMGLARGGSLDNAVVISGDNILNDGGLRYRDEFVRHKILDSIGDLYLAGHPVVGHYHGNRSGHAQTLRLLRKLFADDSAWEWTTLPARENDAQYPTQERTAA